MVDGAYIKAGYLRAFSEQFDVNELTKYHSCGIYKVSVYLLIQEFDRCCLSTVRTGCIIQWLVDIVRRQSRLRCQDLSFGDLSIDIMHIPASMIP